MTNYNSKTVLMRELSVRFGAHGFRRHKDKEYDRFERPVTGARQDIVPSIYQRSGFVELDSPTVSLRIDAVEELVARFEQPNPLIGPIDIQARATIGFRVEPEGMLAVFRKSWNIATLDDAISAAEIYVPKAVRAAEAFWKKYSDPRDVLTVLLGSDTHARRLGGPDNIRAKKALALMIVLDGVRQAEEAIPSIIASLTPESANEVQEWFRNASTSISSS